MLSAKQDTILNLIMGSTPWLCSRVTEQGWGKWVRAGARGSVQPVQWPAMLPKDKFWWLAAHLA